MFALVATRKVQSIMLFTFLRNATDQIIPLCFFGKGSGSQGYMAMARWINISSMTCTQQLLTVKGRVQTSAQ